MLILIGISRLSFAGPEWFSGANGFLLYVKFPEISLLLQERWQRDFYGLEWRACLKLPADGIMVQ